MMTGSSDAAELEEGLGSDLWSLVRARGVPLLRCTAITALPSPVRKRGAFALDFADGMRLKGRRLESAQRADRVVQLRAAVGAGFSSLLARRGDALLLEWVAGRSLASPGATSPDILRRCGRMLGALHRQHSGSTLDGVASSPDDLLHKLQRNAELLRDAERIDAELARRALDAAEADRPAAVTFGIILKDFCAENIVLGDDGELVCIDDASLSVGPHDLDLARTWYRWPMDREALARFEAGYEEQRSLAEFRRHFRFWATYVLIGSAATRLRARAAGGLEPIARLRRLHASGGRRAAARAPTQSTHLRFEDCDVRVRSSDGGDLRWLSAFLACGFEEIPDGAGDRRVELIVDSAAYDRLRASGCAGSGAQVEGFARDSSPSMLERWSSNGSTSIFHEARHPIFYVISEDAARVAIVARERMPRCRTALMRVVRELTMDRVVATGGILVHGSAIGLERGVVVMCGPKRSGKTSLLMSLLETPGTRYVANDRCVVRFGEATVSVRGLPTLVSIRCDTLERFPAARARLARIRPDLTDLAGTPQAQRTSFSLSPPEFCELMGDCPRASGGPLRALIFPRITAGPAPLTLHRLDAAQALERLRTGLFRAGYASPLGQAFASRASASAISRREDHQRIAETISSFDCRIGAGQTLGKDACRGLLESVT